MMIITVCLSCWREDHPGQDPGPPTDTGGGLFQKHVCSKCLRTTTYGLTEEVSDADAGVEVQAGDHGSDRED